MTEFLGWLTQRPLYQSVGILLLLGGLSGFAFAPFYLFPVLAISYPILLILLFTQKNIWGAIFFGWCFAFAQMFTGISWIAAAFEVDDRYWVGVGYLSVAGLSMLLALYSGLALGALHWLFRSRNPKYNSLSIMISFAVLWSLAEWARGHFFTGFPWNLTGYIWGFSDVMLQTTSLWGIYSLGLITLFLAAIPFGMIQSRDNKKAVYGGAFVALIIISSMGLYGTVQLSQPTTFHEDVKLKIVQANINQEDKWDPDKKTDNFIKYLDMSRSRPEEGITHVIWPETAVIYFLDTEPSRRYLIAEMLNDNAVVMTGFPRVLRRPEFQAWNSFGLVDAEGGISNIYDKYHLVPFGEYMPDILSNSLSFLGLGMLVEGFSYSRGDAIKTQHYKSTPPFGVLICYEIIFPDAVVDQNDRPDWLLNITNDAWFGTFNGPYQHLLQTRVRAIEEGLPIIRSAGTGMSAVIDPYGRIIKKLSLNEQGVIVSGLPHKRENVTVYSKNSNWIFFLFVLSLTTLVALISCIPEVKNSWH